MSEAQTTFPPAETLVSTAITYLKVFTSLDASTIAHIQTPDYTHQFAPQSTNPPGPLSREEFARFVSSIRKVVSDFRVTPQEIWPNPSLRQVVVLADSAPIFRDEVKDRGDEAFWTYKGEYIFIITLDDKAEKVTGVLEFVDSIGTERVKALIARATANKEKIDAKK